jgi:hypothetical protein
MKPFELYYNHYHIIINGMIFYSYIKTITMEEKRSSRGRGQDRRKVAGGQEYEVNYESKKTGTSTKQVKKAIESAGNERSKVEKKLNK